MLRWLGTGLLAFGLLVGGAGPAFAHAELLSTDPEYGASVARLDRVVVRYDLPVDVRGAEVTLQGSGRRVPVVSPAYGSADHREVTVPMPALSAGRYVLTWFLFGSDGDVMGGELPFTVATTPIVGPPVPTRATLGPPAPAAAISPPAAGAPPDLGRVKALTPFARAQDLARLLEFASLAVLLGGVTFVARLWRDGAAATRSRVLLGGALGVALMATVGNLGLKGAAVSGRSALEAFSPGALTALDGTHVGRVLAARLAFYVLAVPLVASVLVNPSKAVCSRRWWIGAAISGTGALGTHGLLSHASTRGPLPVAADVIHLGAVSVWLGGLTFLGIVVLPRRRLQELSRLGPRFSRLAFGCVSTAAVAGSALLLLLSPRWGAIPGSSYGRFLLLKLGLVIALLAVASRARAFLQRRLPDLAHDEVEVDRESLGYTEAPAEERVLVAVGGTAFAPAGPAGTIPTTPLRRIESDSPALRPFVTAVSAELCIGASILAATAALVGRAPPS
jgi:putative copper export protein/methionine-rich copper-binding protein CopC